MTLTMHDLKRQMDGYRHATVCGMNPYAVPLAAFDTIWDYARRLEQARDADDAMRCRLESRIRELQDRMALGEFAP